MMREILFRGKRVDNGEWVTGYYIKAVYHWHKHGIHEDWIICGAAANGGWFAVHNRCAVDPETVGQFTGLTDKNGKQIFEGDILKYQINIKTAIVGKIAFICGAFVFESAELEQQCDLAFVTFADDEIALPQNYIEVIGNIHDQPELLKG